MSLKTAWGYTITDSDTLADMITTEEFNALTGNKYAGDVRIEPNIKAASAKIRSFCGWHVYPSAACELKTTFYDKRVTKMPYGISVQLPTSFVTAITSIKIGGEEHSQYALESNGFLRVFGLDAHIIEPYTELEVVYQAGLSDALVDALKQIAAHRTTIALASTNGVQSESTGGVSVTYAASWTNSSGTATLSDSEKELLVPYRITGAL